ncbi:hypothetical protein GCM10014715_54300 [Streptomyces spiralis]|uniref:Uncharacterized protein n=1 Tax=Streptomyces spiralis TaxID=66376 RepID=A0A919DYI5_9ACTN|nr:hypothetical protein GCM10014715_54300 [Streptomyces spiralis]
MPEVLEVLEVLEVHVGAVCGRLSAGAVRTRPVPRGEPGGRPPFVVRAGLPPGVRGGAPPGRRTS